MHCNAHLPFAALATVPAATEDGGADVDAVVDADGGDGDDDA